MVRVKDASHIVLGPDRWDGPEDLSVEMTLAVDAEALYVGVSVRDDTVVTRAPAEEAPMFFGDCVQLSLDLRPEVRQGMPFFDGDVPLFFLVPGHPTPWYADWSFGDRPERTVAPPSTWAGIKMLSTVEQNGYRVGVVLPLKALRGASGGASVIGFDIVVDDTDDGGWRDTQMVWAGTALNYLNPSCYGVVRLVPEPQSAPGMLPIVRVNVH
jgi:hypothetical protein